MSKLDEAAQQLEPNHNDVKQVSKINNNKKRQPRLKLHLQTEKKKCSKHQRTRGQVTAQCLTMYRVILQDGTAAKTSPKIDIFLKASKKNYHC